jgi:chromosome partitioning protein
MIVTIAGFKGGVGKTTSAIHFAAYLQKLAPTVLVDGDPNRSATTWARHGKLPFKVVDERSAAKHARGYEHIVIDTKARPDEEDLKALAEGCDLLIIPTKPDTLSLDALRLTTGTLRSIGATNYQVLLTIVPPKPSRDGEDAHAALVQANYPVFNTLIRRFKAFEDAATEGVPVYALTGNKNAQEGWSDYAEAGKEISL